MEDETNSFKSHECQKSQTAYNDFQIHPEIFAIRNAPYKWLNMLLCENEALRSNFGFFAAGCMLVDRLTLGLSGAGIAYKIKCQ